MKKIIIIATAGVFLFSLQGGSLAQKEEKAPAQPPMIEKQIPAAPKAEAPPAPKEPEVKSAEPKAETKPEKKVKKKKIKKKPKKEQAPVE
ncbi:MAG: hypothetical protein A3K23_06460 [Desulfobacca sp. RBG_16_58_9]|nr:MAG: hypothetical protein A3K23_06460 [Desulfobacca sp. RBG_16_58_9]